MNLLDEDYYELVYQLEKYHEIFGALFKISQPYFSEQIERAAVTFDQQGCCINFLINPKYWRSISDYTKHFVICHEMCHVILNHGGRMVPFRDKYTPDIINMALDLAVNHLLTKSFGFNRFLIDDWNELCWVDTCFKEQDFPANKSFEYYILKIKENLEKINVNIKIISHDYLSQFDNKAKDIIDKNIKALLGEDKLISINRDNNGINAGFEEGVLHSVLGKHIKLKKIRKWESVLHKYMHKVEMEHETLQWIRANRRISCLNSNIFLPSEGEIIDKEFYKYNIWLFLDYSGSCSSLKPLFFSASKTFSPQKFNIKKFAHTTTVSPFNGDKTNPYGGGTRFSCIENFILEQINQKKINKYPDAIFHFTDGYGDNFNAKHPERWYVFLTKRSIKTCYHAKTNFFQLSDFVEPHV